MTLLLVAITIAIVTAKIGPGLDATEMRERQEQREERLDQRRTSRGTTGTDGPLERDDADRVPRRRDE